MIIDFHTHVFPESIAKRTLEFLSKQGGISPFADGTARGLAEKIAEAGVDIAVNLPVLTRPESFDSVNQYAKLINEAYSNDKSARLISFGAIHPACDNVDEKMAFLKKLGFLGVKIHPDYQGTYIDDAGYAKILNAAREYDLTVVTHAGVDFAYPNDVHCTAAGLKRLLRKAPHKKLVVAHLGGVGMQEEFLKSLADEDVYFDTAYVLRYINGDILKKWISGVGAERILFASDSPWSEVKGDVEILKSFDIDENTKEKIFSLNAKRLLGI